MQKTTIYGLPLNPMPKLNELEGASFCVSFATRAKLGKQLDQAIDLVGEDQILMVDNGAFSFWKAGTPAEHVLSDEYLDAWEAWARDILDRCPQAIAVIPDVIGGTVDQNHELISICTLDKDRCMPVWHLDEPLEWLQYLCEDFAYVAFGSTHVHVPGTDAWKARIAEAFAAIDAHCTPENGYVRPRIHMMRAQQFAHLFDFDSSDSTNVAVNHNRQLRKSGESISAFAGRIAGKIAASCDGVESEHQTKQPHWHLDTVSRELEAKMQAELLAYAIELGRIQITKQEDDMDDDLKIPAFLDRKTNGIVSGENTEHNGRYVQKAGIVWPRKKNWRKIAERRRARDKHEGSSLAGATISNHRGQ